MKHPGMGRVYDLQSLFDRLNRLYFDQSLDLVVKWSHRKPKRAKSSIELGSYQSEVKTIVLSRRLDSTQVPLFFVEHVLFHEMLHAVFPSEKHRMHTSKFKRYERMHPDFDRAIEWEKNSLDVLFKPEQSELPF